MVGRDDAGRIGGARWIMLHFGCAISALLAALVLLVAGYADPVEGLRAPSTLIAVHLTTIGWLSLLMLGAPYQFVPVILNTSLYSQRLPILGLGFIGVGLASMPLDCLALSGVSALHMAYLPIGGSRVLIGFVLGGTNIGLTLWKIRPLPLYAGFAAASLVCLLLTAVLEIALALTFALPRPPVLLLQLSGAGISLHMAAGLGGWSTLTVMGVSYRLLSTFMLAPGEPLPSVIWVLIAILACKGGKARILGSCINTAGSLGPLSLTGQISLCEVYVCCGVKVDAVARPGFIAPGLAETRACRMHPGSRPRPSSLERPYSGYDKAALQGQQLGPVQARQFIEQSMAFLEQTDLDPPPVLRGTPAFDIAEFFAARNQRHDAVRLCL